MSVLAFAAAAALSAASPCQGPAVEAGAQVTGTVLQVIDENRLCLAKGPTPDSWSEVRIKAVYVHPASDRDPAYGKAALMSVAFAKKLDCVIDQAGLADCRADGERIVDLMSAPGATLKAAAWIGPRDVVQGPDAPLGGTRHAAR